MPLPKPQSQYQRIMHWIVKDILATTEARGDIEANVDHYMEVLTNEVQRAAELLGEEQFRLQCETNTPAMQRKITRLFKQVYKGEYSKNHDVEVVFRAGQWWVRYHDTGAAWCSLSVCDDDPGRLNSGLDFEEVDEIPQDKGC